MEVIQAIQTRRAYRSLDPFPVTPELIEDLGRAASLSASCFNNQPWRFVFVHGPEALEAIRGALKPGNEWAGDASMIVAVCSRPDLDCRVKGRDYYLFDTGMAAAFLILRATELGLVAHPIAGYDEERVKGALGAPEDTTVITLLIVGRHQPVVKLSLSEKQRAMEGERPERKPLAEMVFHDRYSA